MTVKLSAGKLCAGLLVAPFLTGAVGAEDVTYKVVVNFEGQYSIWPQWKEIPAGWKEVGVSGAKQE
jgi:MbtH protein